MQGLQSRALSAHPSTPCHAVIGLTAAFRLSDDRSRLLLRYQLRGRLEALALPASTGFGAAADNLWEHSCFEAFLGHPDMDSYHEFNFSPCGDWAAYAFQERRVRDPDAASFPAPRAQCDRTGSELTLHAEVTRPPALADSPQGMRLGLSAVIETRDGHLSYWALQHPDAERPDFHHPDGWIARL